MQTANVLSKGLELVTCQLINLDTLQVFLVMEMTRDDFNYRNAHLRGRGHKVRWQILGEANPPKP